MAGYFRLRNPNTTSSQPIERILPGGDGDSFGNFEPYSWSGAPDLYSSSNTSCLQPIESTLPGDDDGSFGSFEPFSQYGTMDSYDSSNTGYSRANGTDLIYIDPKLTRPGITSGSQCQTYSTDMLPVALPDHLTAAATSDLTPFSLQYNSPAQAAGYASQDGDYFGSHPSYPRYSAVGQQGSSSDPQGQELVPNLFTSDIPVLPLPPSKPMHRSGNPGTEAGGARPGPSYICSCGKAFGRQTDLDRHLRTSKNHRGPDGPTCPVSGCRYTTKFTRADNFKAHYRKQHGMGEEEADRFIRDWTSRNRL